MKILVIINSVCILLLSVCIGLIFIQTDIRIIPKSKEQLTQEHLNKVREETVRLTKELEELSQNNKEWTGLWNPTHPPKLLYREKSKPSDTFEDFEKK